MMEEVQEQIIDLDFEDKKNSDVEIIETIESRQTEELIIGFCGPIGSGVTKVAQKFIEKIENFRYDTDYIKISDIIKEKAITKDFIKNIKDKPKGEQILLLQDEGNKLRKEKGEDILAQYAIEKISVRRYEGKKDYKLTDTEKTPEIRRRFVTIIDSLKHPSEVKLLQIVYGKMFYLFGVLCPEKIRLERLISRKYIDKNEAQKAIERDKEEKFDYGQKLINTIQHADFFIRNIKDNDLALGEPVIRIIKLILGDISITPTIDEYAMFISQSTALKSGCLSRQVGASIISENNELIATGCNDAPKFGGGLYSSEDGNNDKRCISGVDSECKNDKIKETIVNDISKIINENVQKITTTETKTIYENIKNHSILSNLLEFSRAIHAEMDAITSASRQGSKLLNSKLYCTAFPCHNCARHIIASGIKEVYYIEPYEKSMALELHGDALTLDEDNNNKVKILPFHGVAPKQFYNLFKFGIRKIHGKKIEQNIEECKPSIAKFLDTFITYEAKVVEFIKESEEEKKSL